MRAEQVQQDVSAASGNAGCPPGSPNSSFNWQMLEAVILNPESLLGSGQTQASILDDSGLFAELAQHRAQAGGHALVPGLLSLNGGGAGVAAAGQQHQQPMTTTASSSLSDWFHAQLAQCQTQSQPVHSMPVGLQRVVAGDPAGVPGAAEQCRALWLQADGLLLAAAAAAAQPAAASSLALRSLEGSAPKPLSEPGAWKQGPQIITGSDQPAVLKPPKNQNKPALPFPEQHQGHRRGPPTTLLLFPPATMKGISSAEGGGAKPQGFVHRRCIGDHCRADLSDVRRYFKRRKLCERCIAASSVLINGVESRYCQQCSCTHGVDHFDEGKRSCRFKLEKHKIRARVKRRSSSGASSAGRLSNTGEVEM